MRQESENSVNTCILNPNPNLEADILEYAFEEYIQDVKLIQQRKLVVKVEAKA